MNQRLSRMRLQSAVPLTEVQVLDTASRFLTSSSPNVMMTIALALMLGALIGAAGAILLEYLNPRVRSWGGVERMLGVPVVGRIALPRQGPGALPGPRHGPLLEARAA
jgi:capsular polysaccharide biosynthesis protein